MLQKTTVVHDLQSPCPCPDDPSWITNSYFSYRFSSCFSVEIFFSLFSFSFVFNCSMFMLTCSGSSPTIRGEKIHILAFQNLKELIYFTLPLHLSRQLHPLNYGEILINDFYIFIHASDENPPKQFNCKLPQRA